MNTDDFVAHLNALQAQTEAVLHAQGYDALVIHSGRTHNYFWMTTHPILSPILTLYTGCRS